MTTYLGKSCSFGLPRVLFVNCRQFMYLVISLLVLRAGCGIWLYQFLIFAYLFTFQLANDGFLFEMLKIVYRDRKKVQIRTRFVQILSWKVYKCYLMMQCQLLQTNLYKNISNFISTCFDKPANIKETLWIPNTCKTQRTLRVFRLVIHCDLISLFSWRT